MGKVVLVMTLQRFVERFKVAPVGPGAGTQGRIDALARARARMSTATAALRVASQAVAEASAEAIGAREAIDALVIAWKAEDGVGPRPVDTAVARFRADAIVANENAMRGTVPAWPTAQEIRDEVSRTPRAAVRR